MWLARIDSAVHRAVTVGTHRNQVPETVISTMGSKLLVMNLQIDHRSAVLAPPSIPLEHLLADPSILVLVMRGHLALLSSWALSEG